MTPAAAAVCLAPPAEEVEDLEPEPAVEELEPAPPAAPPLAESVEADPDPEETVVTKVEEPLVTVLTWPAAPLEPLPEPPLAAPASP